MDEIIKGKRLNFTVADVNEVYEGPAGVLWEMLMGEQIHVGAEAETQILAQKAGVSEDISVLDICSALGGPARYLARTYGCRVVGLDATQKMVDEAISRTEAEGLSHMVSYRLGNALDIPFKAETFNVVLGQDAWCYVTDKEKLIQEAHRVLDNGGTLAFTDWIQTGNMPDAQWEALNGFMSFPYMETLDGYGQLLECAGFSEIEMEDLSDDFALHCHMYQDKLRDELKDMVVEHYGMEMFQAVDDGLDMWVQAADEGKVGRGRLVGKKV